MLIQSLWISGRTKPLTIFLPEELSSPLQQWLNAIYLGPDFIPFEIKFVAWESTTALSNRGTANSAARDDSFTISLKKIRERQVQIVQSSRRAFRFSCRFFRRSG